MAKGKYHEALDTFDMALKKANSTDMDIVLICDSWMGKGTSYFNLKEFENAINCYKKASEIRPNFSDVWYDIG